MCLSHWSVFVLPRGLSSKSTGCDMVSFVLTPNRTQTTFTYSSWQWEVSHSKFLLAFIFRLLVAFLDTDLLSPAPQVAAWTGRWSFLMSAANTRWVWSDKIVTESASTARDPTSCTWTPATGAWWTSPVEGLWSCNRPTVEVRRWSRFPWMHRSWKRVRACTASSTSGRASRSASICTSLTSSRC